VPELRHGFHVISLQLKHLFIFSVLKNDYSVKLIFDLLLKIHIVYCGVGPGLSEILRSHCTHNVNLFDENSISLEFSCKIFSNLVSHFRLGVSQSIDSDILNEITERFIKLLLKVLFQSIWTKVIKESFSIFLQSFFRASNMEITSYF